MWILTVVLATLVAGCSQPADTVLEEPEVPLVRVGDVSEAEPVSSPSAGDQATEQVEVELTNHVLLGSPELTAGIPGEGPLTIEEIKAWLDDPRNHEELVVELPEGLRAGTDNIRGLDENPMTRAKIELGRQLYFDRRLSSDGTISCADCHHPDEAYARNTRFGIGISDLEGDRNSPVAFNRILSDVQFWDGRAATLEEQAIGPIENPIEMGNTHDAAVETLREIEGYRLQFDHIFDDGLTIDNVGRAIATFERALVTGPAPADYYEPLRAFKEVFAEDLEDLEFFKEEEPDLYEQYLELTERSEQNPMSEAAKRGREIFFTDRGRCTACHTGANFTDEEFHNLGVGMDQDEPDLGRYLVTGVEEDRGAFKTPTIRNVELTAPYMHDGSLDTLEEVVEFYDEGGIPNPWLSEDMQELNLTDQEKADLVEYMKALTSELPKVEMGRLPE